MLEKVKAALQLTTTTFDTEINDLVSAGVTDLNIAGVTGDSVSTSSTDAVVQRALISYCVYQFEALHGSLDRSKALKASYDEQKAQLSTHTGYTDWGNTNE